MYHYDPKLFKQRLLGEEGVPSLHVCTLDWTKVLFIARPNVATNEDLQRFWDRQRKFRWFKEHPVLSDPDTLLQHESYDAKQDRCNMDFFKFLFSNVLTQETKLDRCIPLIVHGDDADAHRRRSFCVVSWASVLIHGCSPWDSKYMIYCTDNYHATAETYAVLDAWAVFSLTELQLGRYLDVGPYGPLNRSCNGQLIADGWRGILVFHKGDEKYFQRCYGMRTSWVSNRICWYCKAEKDSASPNLYTLHGPCAPHRSSMNTTEEFIALVCSPNPWVRLPGWNIEVILSDWLHIVDLTLTPECAASVTWFFAVKNAWLKL